MKKKINNKKKKKKKKKTTKAKTKQNKTKQKKQNKHMFLLALYLPVIKPSLQFPRKQMKKFCHGNQYLAVIRDYNTVNNYWN